MKKIYTCINCGKKLSDYRNKRCRECFRKQFNYTCLNCGNKVSRKWNKLCQKCYVKTLKGKGNPMFGKKRLDMRGKNHPNWKPKVKLRCPNCNKIFYDYHYRIKNTKNICCSCECAYKLKALYYKGKGNPNYLHGEAYFPYPLGWNKTFKEQIRYRDHYKCQLCGCPEIECIRKLAVHHIDYDKQNLNPINLISLCNSCHIKTNKNRSYWTNYFKEKINV